MTSAWALIAVSAGTADQFSPSVRSRARSRRASLVHEVSTASDLNVVASLMGRALGARAERRLYRAVGVDLLDVREDPRLDVSGVAVPASQLSEAEAVEGYVRSDALDPFIERYLLSGERAGRANVFLHVINGDWQVDDLLESDLVVAADLAEHAGSRERARAQEIVAHLAAAR